MDLIKQNAGLILCVIRGLTDCSRAIFIKKIGDRLGPIEITAWSLGLQFLLIYPVIIKYCDKKRTNLQADNDFRTKIIKNDYVDRSKTIKPRIDLLHYDQISGWRPLLAVMARGILGSIALSLAYYCQLYLPIGEATSIEFTGMIYSSLFAWFFLGEKLKKYDILLLLTCLVGCILVAHPKLLFNYFINGVLPEGSESKHIIYGVVLGIICSVMASICYVIIRFAGKSIHFSIQHFYYCFFGFIILWSFSYFFKKEFGVTFPLTKSELYNLSIISVLQGIGNVSLVSALRFETMNMINIYRSSQIFMAMIFDVVILKIVPAGSCLVGATFIIGSIVISAAMKMRGSKVIDS